MKENKPIELSGRVYLSGILADDYKHFAPPADWLPGDIKLHNVNKGGQRPRFGKTISFAGFIVASVYDGKNFRRFLLRKRGAVESTYEGPVGRRECSLSVSRYLRTLVRRQAVWSTDQSGYQVLNGTAAPLSVAAAPAPGTPTFGASAPAASTPAPAGLTPPAAPACVVTPAVSGPASADKPSTVVSVGVSDGKRRITAVQGKGRRRGYGKKVDPNQLPLF